MPALTDILRSEYQLLFDTCIIRKIKYPAVDRAVQTIVSGKVIYEEISAATGVPWYMIGTIHKMESDCAFNRHLHNGDPLAARTVRVPRGRPKKGNPPFSFVESAMDALELEGFTEWNDWSIGGMLYCFEKYNGFGYRAKGIHTPYLWSFSNHYTKGKYVSDGKYDAEAVSDQIGTAVILRRMSELQIAIAGEKDLLSQIENLGKEVVFDPGHYHASAEKLQKLLNGVGQHLKIDGKAGRNTSDAFFRVTGKFLKGDLKVVGGYTI
jgi:lysozyme family protein